MSMLRDARDMVTRSGSQVHWIRLLIAFAGFIAISYGFVRLLQFVNLSDFPIYEFEILAYLAVFITSLVANLTIIAPVPFAIAVIIPLSKLSG